MNLRSQKFAWRLIHLNIVGLTDAQIAEGLDMTTDAVAFLRADYGRVSGAATGDFHKDTGR